MNEPALDTSAQLAATTDAQIRRAVAYWQRKAAGRPMPDRRDIDPVEIPDLLPYIVLWDVLPGGGYRCRLAGTRICELHGREMRGMTTAELHGAANPGIEREYDWTARTRQPHYIERTMFWQEKSYRRYRRVLLPFTDGGEGVAIIMNVASYDTA